MEMPESAFISDTLREVNRLLNLFDKSKELSYLDEAINLLKNTCSAEEFSVLEREQKFRARFRLGIEYFRRNSVTDDPEDIENGLKSIDFGITELASDDQDSIGMINDVAIYLRDELPIKDNEQILRKSIELHEYYNSMLSKEYEWYSSHISNLGNAYRRLHEVTQDIDHINKSISLHRQAINLVQDGDTQLPGLHSNLGNSLRQRSKQTGDIADLEEAICVHRLAVNSQPEAPEEESKFNFSLSLSFRDKYGITGALEDLEAAIFHHKKSLDLTNRKSKDFFDKWADFGRYLRIRYAHLEDGNDIDAAMKIMEFITEHSPPESTPHEKAIFELAIVYRNQYEITGDIKNLR